MKINSINSYYPPNRLEVTFEGTNPSGNTAVNYPMKDTVQFESAKKPSKLTFGKVLAKLFEGTVEPIIIPYNGV
ncbi:MAG: hypothetical protein PHC64_00215 [Candidatus Gastranaerophilales bacterium]|nr:hypothetical protein [Candidatus Gastranaerophilales bacterium]